MGTTTFTGPIKAGDVLDTTGTTPGAVKNVGFVEMAQTVSITQSATAAATAIVIPANSTITGIDLFVTVVWSGTATLSVGTSATATELVSAAAPTAIGRLELSPGTDLTRTNNWVNTGTVDDIIYVISGAPGSPAGAGRLVVRYIQAVNA
jgi:hypothetical protein